MNTKNLFIISLAAALFTGCASGPQKPPSPTEAKFFDITTNYVPTLSATTNAVVAPDPVTQLPVTNYSVLTITNLTPEYIFVPNTNAAGTAQTVGAITNLAAPGFGALATSIIGGLFGIWGTLRSRKANQTASALAQIIETGEQVLLTSPNGPELAAQWKAWMVKHQAETHTISEASKLVANIVDTEAARQAAEQIAAIINKAKS